MYIFLRLSLRDSNLKTYDQRYITRLVMFTWLAKNINKYERDTIVRTKF